MNSIIELARLRARVATLEAENAELRASQKEPIDDDDWYDSGCTIDSDDDWYNSSC